MLKARSLSSNARKKSDDSHHRHRPGRDGFPALSREPYDRWRSLEIGRAVGIRHFGETDGGIAADGRGWIAPA
jgi:hypothetical protein